MKFLGMLQITTQGACSQGKPVFRRVRTPVLVRSWSHKAPPSKGFYLPPCLVEIWPSKVACIKSQDHRRSLILSSFSEVCQGLLVQHSEVEKAQGNFVTPSARLGHLQQSCCCCCCSSFWSYQGWPAQQALPGLFAAQWPPGYPLAARGHPPP